MRIAVVRPGHAMSTLFVCEGMEDGLKELGVEVLETKTERLISMQSQIIAQFKNIYQDLADKQGVDLNQVAVHAGWENVLSRLLYLDYDLLFMVNGRLISPQIMRGIDKLPGPRVIWLTESPYEDEFQSWLASHFDFAFVNDKSSVDVIGKIAPAAYLPHSYDPEIFMRVERPMDRDVFFCYTAFNNRVPIVEALSSSGLNVLLPQAGIVKNEETGMAGVKFIAPERMALMYNTSKVNLNIHRTEKMYGSGENITSAYSLGPRAYEIAACGAFQLCDDTRPELAEVFGDTVATYRSGDDVVDLCRYWVDPARDKLRLDMGVASMERVANCTYTHRAVDVLNQLVTWYNKPEWLKGLGEAEQDEQEKQESETAVLV